MMANHPWMGDTITVGKDEIWIKQTTSTADIRIQSNYGFSDIYFHTRISKTERRRIAEICDNGRWNRSPLKDHSLWRHHHCLWFLLVRWWMKYELLILGWNISIIPLIIEVINKFRFFPMPSSVSSHPHSDPHPPVELNDWHGGERYKKDSA